MSVTNVSQHLQELSAAGLVARRRDGTRIYYRAADDRVCGFVSELGAVARGRLPEVEQLAARYIDDGEQLKPVTRAQLLRRLGRGDAVVVDVRPAEEYESGHVRGAISIPLGELARLMSDGDGDITYERGENHLFFEVGGRLLISRMIDGQFPAYERVIPKGNDKHIEFERDRLTNAVKRVALLSNERSRAVKFLIDKGKVDVTSSSPEIGEATETLLVDYSGQAMQICFNAQYVLDFLAAASTDIVSLDLKDEVSQAVMKPVGAEGYDYTYVIMPMRV